MLWEGPSGVSSAQVAVRQMASLWEHFSDQTSGPTTHNSTSELPRPTKGSCHKPQQGLPGLVRTAAVSGLSQAMDLIFSLSQV